MDWTGSQSTGRAARRRCKSNDYNPAMQDLRRRSIDGLDALENNADFQIMCREFGGGDGASERKAKRRPSNASLNSIPIDELFEEIKTSKCVTSAAAVQLYARQPDHADDDSSTDSENSVEEERQARKSSLDNLRSSVDTFFKAPAQTQNLWGGIRGDRRSSTNTQKSHDRRQTQQRGADASKQQHNTRNAKNGFWSNIMQSLTEEQVVHGDADSKNTINLGNKHLPVDSNTISTVATPPDSTHGVKQNDEIYSYWGSKQEADGKRKNRMSQKTVSTAANSSTDQIGGSSYGGGGEVPRFVSRSQPPLNPIQARMEAKRIIDSVPSEIFLTTNEKLTTDKAPDIPGSHLEYNMFDVECGSNIACENETESISHFSS